MRPKIVILEYGVAEGTTNPFAYDPWAVFKDWPRVRLSDYDYYYNRKTPMPIKSSRHMAHVLGVIRKHIAFDFEIVSLQYEHAKQYLLEHRDSIFVVIAATGGFMNDEFMAQFKDDFYMCISAGNEGDKGEGLGATKPYWTAVGAIGTDYEPKDYSSWGKGLVQFVGFSGEKIKVDYFGTFETVFNGTSAADPHHGTEIANLMAAYYVKNGKKPPMKWVIATRNKHTVDVHEPGKDLKTGYGLYLWNALQPIPTVITLQIGSNEMQVGTKAVSLAVEPQIINGTTMVPLRAISEAFGAEVGYDGPTKTITILK